jgi:hypothetical protein
MVAMGGFPTYLSAGPHRDTLLDVLEALARPGIGSDVRERVAALRPSVYTLAVRHLRECERLVFGSDGWTPTAEGREWIDRYRPAQS